MHTPSPTPDPHALPFERVFPIIVLTFVDVLGLTVILPLLHLYAAAYHATPLQIGLVAAAFPLAQLIGVPVMGALSDRFGRKPLLLISQVSTFASFLMLAGAASLEMVILSRVIDGLFGANYATAQAAITDLTDDRTRAQGLGLTGAAFGVGFLFGPAIALFSLEISDSLATPALVAAAYSAISIALTLFTFKETLPPARRASAIRIAPLLFTGVRVLRRGALRPLVAVLFMQQVVFFAFESLFGLFLLSRIGLLGQGAAVMFLYVGLVLVYTQGRLIGKWSRQHGEAATARRALALLALGLLLLSFTPDAPQPFYIARVVENELRGLAPTAAETVIGTIPLPLPTEANRGIGGIAWLLAALIPLSMGAGLIRPALNTLITRRAADQDRGAVLGVSASFVSLADAIAPLIGGLLFQSIGPSAPFWIGGGVMVLVFLFSRRFLRDS
ncbi:MAG: MFS transporter [bacterium]|nr:MFS transporter [bacterium]